MIPPIGELIERPFVRLGSSRYASEGGGFVLGLSLGPVFVPCAGPVLTAISVAAEHRHVGFSALLVTLFYAIGITLPLLVLAFVARRATTLDVAAQSPAAVRKVAGVVLGVATLAIAFNWLGACSATCPATRRRSRITSSPPTRPAPSCGVERRAAEPVRCGQRPARGEEGDLFRHRRGELQSGHLAAGTTTTTTTTTASRDRAAEDAVFMASKTDLPALGRAPNFTGITAWFNTPGNHHSR